MAETADFLQPFFFPTPASRPSSNTISIPKTLREYPFPPICNNNSSSSNSPDTTTIRPRNHASPSLVFKSTSPIMGPLNPNRASKSISVVPQPQPRRSMSSSPATTTTTAATTPPPLAGNAEETMSGWLLKRSKNLQKSWKRNWFVLRESPNSNGNDEANGRGAQLVYYKDQREYKPKNIINTADILAVVAMEPTHFAIFTDRKDYHLRADTVAECAQWVAKLKKIVERNNIGLASPAPTATSATTAPTSATAPASATTNTTGSTYGLSQSVPTAAISATPAIPISGSGARPSSGFFSSHMGSSPGGGSSLFAHSISPSSRSGIAAAASPESYPGSDYFLSPDEDPEHSLPSPATDSFPFSSPPTAPAMAMAMAGSPTSGSGISTSSSPPLRGGSTKKKKRTSMLGLPRPSFSVSHNHDSAAKNDEETSAAAVINQALESGLVEGYNKKNHYRHWRQQLLVLTHAGLYVYRMRHSVDSTAAAVAGDTRLLHVIPLDCLVDASEAVPAVSKSTGKAYVFELIAAFPSPTMPATHVTSTTAVSPISAGLEPRLRRLRFAVATENDLVRWLAALKLAIDQHPGL
ncbi:hypothetical protein DV495_000444 [Geotrichum candidum]|nr:hypothetical protein DV495_000444 [Geotrichum candidum]